MKASSNESDRFLGAMLEYTMQVPGDDCIYVAGTQPVLIAWGHAKAGPRIERVYLRGEQRAAARPMVILRPPRPPIDTVRRWAPVLVAGLLLSLLLLAGAVDGRPARPVPLV